LEQAILMGFHMSFQAMAWAVKQQLPTVEKFILIMLANYASNDDGDCFPAIDTLMRETGLARSTVQRGLKSLAESGYISAHERWANGRQLSNSYRMAMGWGEGVTQTPRGVTHTPGGLTQTPPGVSQEGPNLSEEPINKPTPQKKDKVDEAELTFDFEIFWAAYPKRSSNPKQPALKSYLKARKEGASKEIILAGVMAYARTRAGKDTEYTAMAATWLNQKRWEDDYGPAKQVRTTGNFV
jgi:hypothetical protein